MLFSIMHADPVCSSENLMINAEGETEAGRSSKENLMLLGEF